MAKFPFYNQVFTSRPAGLQRQTRRRGTVLHVVAGALILLCGCAALVVDYGILIADKNHLQRVCDAAALGGATKLTDTVAATTTAQLVAGQNQFVDDNINDLSISFLENNRRIRVEAVRRRSLFFARVLGQNVGVVRAVAIAGTVGSTPDIVPIGITTTSYDNENPLLGGGWRKYDLEPSPTFTTKLINRQKEAFDPGEFILFDMRPSSAKSPRHMQRQLAGEEEIDVKVNDLVDEVQEATAVNANARTQADFFSEGMTVRFQAAAGLPWLDIDLTQALNYTNYVGQHYTQVYNGSEPTGNGNPFFQNPRVMSYIVTHPVGQASGTYNAPIIDLASVYVMRIYNSAGNMYMDYRYLPSKAGAGGSGYLYE